MALEHVKAMNQYFCNSPQRTQELQEAHRIAMADLKSEAPEATDHEEMEEWNMVSIKQYNATRWLGLSSCLESLNRDQAALRKLKEFRIEAGYGPKLREGDSVPSEPGEAPEHDRGGGTCASDASTGTQQPPLRVLLRLTTGVARVQGPTACEEGDGSDDGASEVLACAESDDESAKGIVQGQDNLGVVEEVDGGEQAFCGPGGQEQAPPSDLTKEENDGLQDKQDMLVRADQTEVGNTGAAKKKRDILLNPVVGVTDTNWGIVSALCPLMRLYRDLMLLVQTTLQPVQPWVGRWITAFVAKVKAKFLTGNHLFPPEYQAWRATMVKLRKADLVTHMDSIIKSMAQRLITRVQERIAPYQPYLDAYCLVDPFGVALEKVSDEAWAALLSICVHYGLNCGKVKDGISDLRANASVMSDDARKTAHENLLRFYHDQDELQELDAALKKYVRCVFSIPVTTVLIESRFSGMNYNKSKHRSRLTDDRVMDILRTQELQDATADKGEPFKEELSLNYDKYLQSKVKHGLS
jgi:hypothetical protein